MSSLLGAAAGFRSAESDVNPRSVTPGRQRWDVKLVLGRPRTAEFLAAALRRIPGITEARANPVTGGVLVRHDARLRAADVGRIVRRAVTLVAEDPTGAGRPAPARPVAAPAPQVDRGLVVRPVLAVGGGVAAGVALVKGSALSRQLVAVGGVAALTTAVLRKAWRGTVDVPQEAAGPGVERHPLLEIVGPHRRRLYGAVALSVACQVSEMALGTFLGWTGLVLIKGEAAPLARLGLTTASAQLFGLAGLMAVACAAVAGLSYSSNLQWRRLGQDIEHDWRNRTYAHVQHLELRHLEGERTTRIMRRAHRRRPSAGHLLRHLGGRPAAPRHQPGPPGATVPVAGATDRLDRVPAHPGHRLAVVPLPGQSRGRLRSLRRAPGQAAQPAGEHAGRRCHRQELLHRGLRGRAHRPAERGGPGQQPHGPTGARSATPRSSGSARPARWPGPC